MEVHQHSRADGVDAGIHAGHGRSEERSVEAVILKNRNGRTGGKVGFSYYSLFNCFEQDYGFSPVNEGFTELDEDDDLIPFAND